jgi:hypothetical protein
MMKQLVVFCILDCILSGGVALLNPQSAPATQARVAHPQSSTTPPRGRPAAAPASMRLCVGPSQCANLTWSGDHYDGRGDNEQNVSSRYWISSWGDGWVVLLGKTSALPDGIHPAEGKFYARIAPDGESVYGGIDENWIGSGPHGTLPFTLTWGSQLAAVPFGSPSTAPAAPPAPLVQQQRGVVAEAAPDHGDAGPGSSYALVIGIDSYAAPLPRLKTAVNDARAFASLLSSKYGFQVTTALNQDATRDKILSAITHFRKSLAENDSFLIYYAGHGSFDRETDKGYWLPVDADPDPLNTSRDISADDLITQVRGLAARHVIIISDSCFSGDLSRDAGDMSPSDGNLAYIRRMQRAPSRTLMASGSDEPVSDSGSQGHSVFAALLLQTMQSHSEQAFTADDLFVSIRRSVLARSGQSPQYTSLHDSIRASASFDTGDFVFNPRGVGTRAK